MLLFQKNILSHLWTISKYYALTADFQLKILASVKTLLSLRNHTEKMMKIQIKEQTIVVPC